MSAVGLHLQLWQVFGVNVAVMNTPVLRLNSEWHSWFYQHAAQATPVLGLIEKGN
jgi:hypothetical protein